eukprot:6378520-Amphidinium_carterae.1
MARLLCLCLVKFGVAGKCAASEASNKHMPQPTNVGALHLNSAVAAYCSGCHMQPIQVECQIRSWPRF